MVGEVRASESTLMGGIAIVVVLAGCVGPNTGMETPTFQAHDNPEELADFAGCHIEGPDGLLDCESPFEELTVEASPGTGWLCVDSSRSGDPAFEVYYHPIEQRVGVRFETSEEADLYSGWIDVVTADQNVTYTHEGSESSGFISIPEPVVEPRESVTLDINVAPVTYGTNSSILEDADRSVIWIPKTSGGDGLFRYWAIHHFDAPEESYYFSQLIPVPINYEMADFSLQIGISNHVFSSESSPPLAPGPTACL